MRRVLLAPFRLTKGLDDQAMIDDAPKLAEFLIEHARSVGEADIMGEIFDLFPDLSDEEFFRGFAIAEELLIDDIQDAVQAAQSYRDVKGLMVQYTMLRDYRQR